MIVEVIVATAGAVTLGGLWFADRVLRREHVAPPEVKESRRAAIAEKRRVLERDRAEWMRAKTMTAGITQIVQQIDRQLIAIADEEARLLE